MKRPFALPLFAVLLLLARPVFAEIPPAPTNAPPVGLSPDDGDPSRNGDVDWPFPPDAVDHPNAPFDECRTNAPAQPPPVDDGKAPAPWPFGPLQPPPGVDPPPGPNQPPAVPPDDDHDGIEKKHGTHGDPGKPDDPDDPDNPDDPDDPDGPGGPGDPGDPSNPTPDNPEPRNDDPPASPRDPGSTPPPSPDPDSPSPDPDSPSPEPPAPPQPGTPQPQPENPPPGTPPGPEQVPVPRKAPGPTKTGSPENPRTTPLDTTEPGKADPVGVTSGAVTTTGLDLLVCCPDFDLAFRRVYSSSVFASGALGKGWTHNWEWNLVPVNGGEWMKLRALADPGSSEAANDFHFQRLPDGAYSMADVGMLVLRQLPGGAWTVTAPGETIYRFGADGVFESVSLHGETVVSLVYSDRDAPAARRLARVDHACGKSLRFSYGENGLLARVDSPDPAVYAVFSYTDAAEPSLAAATRMDGDRRAVMTYRYGEGSTPDPRPFEPLAKPYAADTVADPSPGRLFAGETDASKGLLVEKTDPNGVAAHFVYTKYSDAPGARATYTVLDGGLYETEFWFGPGLTVERKTVAGHKVRVETLYDPDTAKIQSTQCGALVARSLYGPRGDETWTMLSDTNTWAYEMSAVNYGDWHNATHWASSYCSLPSNFWAQAWDETWMQPQTVRSPAGRESHWERAGQDLLVFGAGTNSALARAVLLCDEAWRVTNAVDANGHAVATVRDAAGYVARVESAGEPAVAFDYDSLGRVSSVSLPGPGGSVRTTATVNNAFGLPLSVVHPDGASESWLYDGTWRHATNHVDALGRTDEIKWVLGLPVLSSRRAADGMVIPLWSLKHDRQLNVLSVFDPLGRAAESYVLDRNERVVAVTNLEGQVMVNAWAVGDRLADVRRFDGSLVRRFYDWDGNLSCVRYPDGDIRFRHDRDGLLTSASNAVGLVTNVYNEAAWLASTTGADGTPVCYGYHPAGQVASVVSVAGETAYGLDEANRVSRIASPHAAFDFGYGDWNGLVTSVTNDAGIVAEFAYDLRDRLTNIVYRSPSGAEIARFDYALDAIGRIVDRTVDIDSADPRRVAFAYDDLDRLVGESEIDGTGRTYSYDLAGNRLRKTDTATGVVDYTLGLGDRLATFTGGAYGYNAAGCVTNIAGGAGGSPADVSSRALAWNSQYQLLSVSTNGVSAESWTWDPLGRRASTTTATGTIRHVYDGDEFIADLDDSGAVVRSYVWGPGVDNLLAIQTSGATYYAITDHQNTVHGFVDASGALVAHYVYDAWGNVLESTVSVPALAGNRYLFQGREYSWATGLYNFRARWYDPATGRWLSKDPIGIGGGMNLYAFCGNCPTCFVDPSGNMALAMAMPFLFSALAGVGEAAATIGATTIAVLSSPITVAVLTATAVGIAAAIIIDEVSSNPTSLEKRSGENIKSATNDSPKGGHHTNVRRSNRERHENGDSRRLRDQKRSKKLKEKRGGRYHQVVPGGILGGEFEKDAEVSSDDLCQ